MNINTLTPSDVASTIHQIIQTKNVLAQYYEQSSNRVRVTIFNHLTESYIYECKIAGKMLPIDEYQDDIEKAIGWNWVLPDPPIMKR